MQENGFDFSQLNACGMAGEIVCEIVARNFGLGLKLLTACGVDLDCSVSLKIDYYFDEQFFIQIKMPKTVSIQTINLGIPFWTNIGFKSVKKAALIINSVFK